MMKKIKISANANEVNLEDVFERTPIFAKRNNQLVGMVVLEIALDGKERWILKIGGHEGATGFHDTRAGCLRSCLQYHYDFYVE